MSPWTPFDLLPGFFCLVVGGGLAVLVHRAFDPLPRHATWLAGGLVFAFFAPVLVGGDVLLPLGKLVSQTPFRMLEPAATRANPLHGDPLQQMAPWQTTIRRAVRAGEWPLWNRHAGAGEPLLGNPQAVFAEPLHALTRVLPFGGDVGARAALTVWTAMLFAFLFLRRWGFDGPIAAGGAAAYALGAFIHLWLAWPLVITAAVLPVACYAALTALDRGRRRDWALVVTSAAWLALAGHPEGTLLAAGMTMIVALARWRATNGVRGSLARLALAAGLGLALTAPITLSAATALSQSLRHHQVTHAHPAGDADPTRRAALGGLGVSLAPHAWGSSQLGAYWGPTTINRDAAGFMGTAVLFAVLLGLLPARRLDGERGGRWLLLISTVLLFRYPPVVSWLSAAPLVGQTEGLSRIALWFGPCTIFLACCTWQRCRAAAPPPGRLAIATSIAILLLSAAYAQPVPTGTNEATVALRLATFLLQLSVVLASALLLAKTIRGRWAKVGLLAIVVPELIVLHGGINPPAPARLLFPDVPAMAFVRERVGEDRVVGIDRALVPNLAAAYGLDDVRTFHAARPIDVHRLLRPATAPGRRTFDRIEQPSHPLMGLLGVRYVVTPRGAWMPAPLKIAFRHPSAWVYERPDPLPRLFLPTAARVIKPDAWPRAVGAIDDFARDTVVTDAPFAPGTRWMASEPSASSLELDRVARADLRATTNLVEPRVLASSLFQDGGWRLLLDGERQTTFRANGPLLAALLPAGVTQVDLLYRPRGFLLGLLISSLAGTTLLTWLVPLGRRRLAAARPE